MKKCILRPVAGLNHVEVVLSFPPKGYNYEKYTHLFLCWNGRNNNLLCVKSEIFGNVHIEQLLVTYPWLIFNCEITCVEQMWVSRKLLIFSMSARLSWLCQLFLFAHLSCLPPGGIQQHKQLGFWHKHPCSIVQFKNKWYPFLTGNQHVVQFFTE